MRSFVLLTTLLAISSCSDDESPGPGTSPEGGAGGSSGASGGTSGGGSGGKSGGSASGGATPSGGAGGSAATGGKSSTGGRTTDAGGAPPSSRCEPLPVSGRTVDVSPADNLLRFVQSASTGDTLLLADGTYRLGGSILQLREPGVSLRGKSGNRDAVVLDGERSAASGEVVSITASDVTVADLTIANAYTHAIHVQTSDGADVLRTVIYNVRITNALEQAIKINLDASESHFPDGGLVACSHLELTGQGRSAVRNNCYTGGVDAHGARDWVIRDNVIEGFWCPEGLSEHAVHFWTGSRDTTVERNRIQNCARGVGFGLGENTSSSTDTWRTYQDAPCGNATPVGHYGGVVRNNFIGANDSGLFASAAGFDSGVALEQACGATVVHNTVFGTTPPSSSAVEWRFANTTATVTNNLSNAQFRNRGGGASATAAGNVESATAAYFADAANGDFHLSAAATGATDKGAAVPGGVCDEDIDGEGRETPRDVGADER